MYELNEDDIQYIKEKMFFSYRVVKKIETDTDRRYRYPSITDIESEGICYCPVNRGKSFQGNRCPYCFRLATKIYPKEHGLDNRGNYYPAGYQGTKSLYIKPTDDGILIYDYTLVVSPMKKIDDKAMESVKVFSIIDVKIGQKTKAYKKTSKGLVEMDLFDALRINTRTIKCGIGILFKDSVGLIDFLIKNKDFAKKTGTINFLNLVDVDMPQNIKFLIYIYILSEYPAVELLVKMGYVVLVSSMFDQLLGCYNKEVIREKAKQFKSLIKDSTKGSDCLMIPKFVADYLNKINADLRDYDIWSTIFSYQDLSKEHFYKVIYEIGCANLVDYRFDITEVMKYGYDIEKLIHYIKKQTLKNEHYGEQIRYLKDYLEMCSLMGEKPDLYPSNIKTAHDNMQKAYSAKKNKLTDINLAKIAENCKKLIPEHDNYTIVIPECVNDFVREGQNQHNCVSSYVDRVLRRKCIIFFIREKTDKEESFVTAEYSQQRLYQIKARNNNPVYKEEILDYARKFCDILKKNEHHIYI